MEIVIAELTEALDHLDAALHQVHHGRARTVIDSEEMDKLTTQREELNRLLNELEEKYL